MVLVHRNLMLFKWKQKKVYLFSLFKKRYFSKIIRVVTDFSYTINFKSLYENRTKYSDE